MPNFKGVVNIIKYITEKDPELLKDDSVWMNAEHDTIFLPIPDGVSREELDKKGEELHFSIDEDSIVVYV
ncbi:hypothetical protein D3C75_323270 [compost metagenome]